MRIAVAAVDLAEKLQCLQNKETAGELTARDEQVAGLLVQREPPQVHGAAALQRGPDTQQTVKNMYQLNLLKSYDKVFK